MRNKTLWIGVIGVLIGVLLSAAVVFAGNLNPTAGPTDPASQMYTLEQIYTRLTGGGNATKMTSFTEPGSGPGAGTMHTLDDIYALSWPARVPKTGLTGPCDTDYNRPGDDCDLQRGVAWPDPRFTDNEDGTVTDNLTGLIWLKDAGCFQPQSWYSAVESANFLNSGECDLTDGSAEGDWRLANTKELFSLFDFGQVDPNLPSGHPFINVQRTGPYAYVWYWTSNSGLGQFATDAWRVELYFGQMYGVHKSSGSYVWPVRGGQ